MKTAETRTIKLMASFDWSMQYTMKHFLEYLDPTLKYKGKSYKVEFSSLTANPVLCGANLQSDADVIVDRTVHWNDFYKFYAQGAANCGVVQVNNPITNDNLDKHHSYDLMARGMHPDDRFPTTVLLPQFSPWTYEQMNQSYWEAEQSYITANTKFGWDPHRKSVDYDKVEENMKRVGDFFTKRDEMRKEFYPAGNYLAETVEKYFDNRFPIYFKKAFGGGGSDVYRVKNMDELYEKYDESEGKAFFLQEAIEGYETFVRCMAIGPQILALRFQPDEPLHQHYSPEKLKLKKSVWNRVEDYVRFIDSFYGWTYNSYEALIKDDVVYPIDFANACPDSNFTSLHTHFPWLICSLTKWFSYLAVVKPQLGTDTKIAEYGKILNDPKLSAKEKYDFHVQKSGDFFQDGAFEQFVKENFSDIDDRMIKFYDEHFDKVITLSIETSDFPEDEHQKMFNYYKDMMETQFRPNAREYLTTDIHS